MDTIKQNISKTVVIDEAVQGIRTVTDILMNDLPKIISTLNDTQRNVGSQINTISMLATNLDSAKATAKGSARDEKYFSIFKDLVSACPNNAEVQSLKQAVQDADEYVDYETLYAIRRDLTGTNISVEVSKADCFDSIRSYITSLLNELYHKAYAEQNQIYRKEFIAIMADPSVMADYKTAFCNNTNTRVYPTLMAEYYGRDNILYACTEDCNLDTLHLNVEKGDAEFLLKVSNENIKFVKSENGEYVGKTHDDACTYHIYPNSTAVLLDAVAISVLPQSSTNPNLKEYTVYEYSISTSKCAHAYKAKDAEDLVDLIYRKYSIDAATILNKQNINLLPIVRDGFNGSAAVEECRQAIMDTINSRINNAHNDSEVEVYTAIREVINNLFI